MKRPRVPVFVIALFIMGSLSSCVSISKIRYLEPIGDNKNDWEIKKTKNAYHWGFYDLEIKRSIKNINGANEGSVSLIFKFTHSDDFELMIVDENHQLLNKIDLDSAASNSIRDSLKRRGVGTIMNLPYQKFQFIADDIKQTQLPLREFFYSYPNLRDIIINHKIPFKKGQKVKIFTGDPFLDNIFQQYTFTVKTNVRFGGLKLAAALGS